MNVQENAKKWHDAVKKLIKTVIATHPGYSVAVVEIDGYPLRISFNKPNGTPVFEALVESASKWNENYPTYAGPLHVIVKSKSCTVETDIDLAGEEALAA